jgi:superfamily I DNA/RNA helicase
LSALQEIACNGKNMPITQQQIQNAQNTQHTAAHDNSSQIRLVAGPGTGKSFAIEERIYWLINNVAPPNSIFVVSFTRAASLDLRNRIIKYCSQKSITTADQVSVTTLHSLALRILRSAGLLQAYPESPPIY